MLSRVTNRFRKSSDTTTQTQTSGPSSGPSISVPPRSRSGPDPQAAPPQWSVADTSKATKSPTIETPAGHDELPVYLGPEDEIRSEHTYSLKNKDVPWLTLKLWSSAGAPTSHPLFFDRAIVDGSVEMVLTGSQGIQSVLILLEGNTRTAGAEAKNFVSLSTTLWPTEACPPKLTPGTYLWPFSLSLPHTITVKQDDESFTVSLPPTFSVKGFPAFLEYRFKVVVSRGALRLDSELSTSVVFLPRTRPAPPSQLRQLTYSNRTDLVGPDGDPDGWSSKPCIIRGVFFSKLDVEVECTLSLAKPLVYARGSALPFMITFESRDTQALDLFALPSSVQVQLEQVIIVGPNAMRPKPNEPSRAPEVPRPVRADAGNNTFRKLIGKGRCLLSKSDTSPEWRRLEGEISLPRDLKPTFSFVRFCLSYVVNVTVDAVGFVPSSAAVHAATFTQDVAIATDRPRGPRQTSTMPPEDAAPPQDSNADAINGLLLNGNQRYLEHHHGGAPG